MMIDEKHLPFFSDGAPAHFKNHSNIYNLLHHKEDFDIEASWTFSASGHERVRVMVLVPQLNQQLLDGCPLLAKGFHRSQISTTSQRSSTMT